MKGKVVVSAFLTNLFSLGRASAVTIFPFIFVQNKILAKDEDLMNHERIHIAQALELLVFPFYVLYCMEFLVRLVYYRKVEEAYLNISFEREAYAKQSDPYYLLTRKIWSFKKYYR
ncbi:MAG: hypothetical protein LBE37_09845 [Sphingobacterium sp.]|jgi:hypothetical protein|nr:hypothetical protein [Sphingobacterium sp.]